jgi:putative hydrolase of the HAD superfamily
MERLVNIVFDLGGVVVQYDRAGLLRELYPDPAHRDLMWAGINEHLNWVEMDRGTLPQAEAIIRAAERCGVPASDFGRFMERMVVGWQLIPETVELLYRLRGSGHALFCLSNMHPESTVFLTHSFDFWEVFTGRVISCEVGLCKPEPAIYAHLLKAYELAAEETIFIDDLDANLLAAASFGIRTIRFEDTAQCVRALRAMGVGC